MNLYLTILKTQYSNTQIVAEILYSVYSCMSLYN